MMMPMYPAAWAEGRGSGAEVRVRVCELVFLVSTFSSFVMLLTFSWVTGSRLSKLTPPELQAQSQLFDANTSLLFSKKTNKNIIRSFKHLNYLYSNCSIFIRAVRFDLLLPYLLIFESVQLYVGPRAPKYFVYLIFLAISRTLRSFVYLFLCLLSTLFHLVLLLEELQYCTSTIWL